VALHNELKRNRSGDPQKGYTFTKVDLKNWFCFKKHNIWLQNYIFTKEKYYRVYVNVYTYISIYVYI